MLNSSVCKLGQVKQKFFLRPIYSKQTFAIFSNTANDLQVNSGKLVQPELQISILILYLDHKNENHFETVESLMKNTVQRKLELMLELMLMLQKPMHLRQTYSGMQDQNASSNVQHQQEK